MQPRHEAERFTIREVDRTEIHGVPYNPRTITAKARAQLKKGIKKVGLIQPLLFNSRNGNLVSGHQRLKILDDLSNGKPYSLTMAVADLSDKEEREANILLNNDLAHGDFDIEKLGEMLRGGLDAEAAGFDASDVHRLFGEDPTVAAALDQMALDEFIDRNDEMLDRYKNVQSGAKSTSEGVDFYCVIVFRDDNDRDAWLAKNGWDRNRYQSGEAAWRLIGGKGDETYPDDAGKSPSKSRRNSVDVTTSERNT
jgi:hypothetical protein